MVALVCGDKATGGGWGGGRRRWQLGTGKGTLQAVAWSACSPPITAHHAGKSGVCLFRVVERATRLSRQCLSLGRVCLTSIIAYSTCRKWALWSGRDRLSLGCLSRWEEILRNTFSHPHRAQHKAHHDNRLKSPASDPVCCSSHSPLRLPSLWRPTYILPSDQSVQ